MPNRTQNAALAAVTAKETAQAGKRIRHTVTNPYHLWANEAYAGNGEDYAADRAGNYMDGGSGTRRSFRGKIAYSYQTEMARIVTNKRGEKAYFLNVGSYSNTTSGHQAEIRNAIPGLRWTWDTRNDGAVANGAKVFCIDPDTGRGRSFMDSIDPDPSAFIKILITRAGECLNDSKKPRLRQTTRDAHIAKASAHLQQARDLAEFFGVKVKIPTDADGVADVLVRAEKKRVADAKKAAIALQKEIAAKKIEDKERFEQWLAGERVYFPTFYFERDYLRLNPLNPAEVQTSRGATVPTDHVRRASPVILRLLRTGQVYDGIPPVRLGYYTLSRIADGVVTVGCHRFERAEIERFAEILKTTEPEPVVCPDCSGVGESFPGVRCGTCNATGEIVAEVTA